MRPTVIAGICSPKAASLRFGMKLLPLLFILLISSGCPTNPPKAAVPGSAGYEVYARDTVAGAKAALEDAKTKFQCGTPNETSQCLMYVTKAVSAKDLAIDALEGYCAGPSFEQGGACTPSADPDAKNNAAIKLQAAVQLLNQALIDLKKVTK